MPLDPKLAAEAFCYVKTTGRVTGRPHEIEIWFAADPKTDTIYILAGSGHDADWVRNLKRQPHAPVRIGKGTFAGTGRIVTTKREDARARKLVLAKYARDDDSLDQWGRTALPVALELRAFG